MTVKSRYNCVTLRAEFVPAVDELHVSSFGNADH